MTGIPTVSGVVVAVPSLAERVDDIPALVRHFSRCAAAIRSVIDGSYVRTIIGTAGRFGSIGLPTIPVGDDGPGHRVDETAVPTVPDAGLPAPATNGATR